MGVCTLGPELEPPLPTPAFSKSLRVTLWGGVAKWGGAKLPGSSVSLSGGRGGPEACSLPPSPPPSRPRWLCRLTFWLQGSTAPWSPRPSAHTHPAPSPQGKNSALVGHVGVCLPQAARTGDREQPGGPRPSWNPDSASHCLLANASAAPCLSFPIGNLETIILLIQGLQGEFHKVLKKKKSQGLASGI